MLKISCKTIRSANLKFISPLFENRITFLIPDLGLQTNISYNYDSRLDNKAAVIKSKSDYLNKVLRKNPKYTDLFYNSQTTFPIVENKCKSLETFQQFYENSYYNDKNNLPGLLAEELPQLTFDETLNLLYWFLKCKNLKNYNEKTLDFPKMGHQIVSHLNLFEDDSKSKIFQSFDVFFSNPYNDLRKRFQKLLKKVLGKLDVLTPQQFVLACNYGLYLSAKKSFYKFSSYMFNRKLYECVSELDLNEIDVISSFFSCFDLFFSNFNGKFILNKLNEDIENPDAFQYHSIMKVMCKRKSFQVNASEFQEKICDKIPNLSFLSLINLFHLEVLDKNIRKIIVQEALNKCNEKFNDYSLTSLQRLLEAMTRFKIYDEVFINNIIKTIEELLKENPEKYAGFMINTISYFMNLQVYPEKLIRSLISAEYCQSLFKSKNNKVLRDWAFNYYSLKIENPKLHPELPEKTIIELDKILKYYRSPLTISSSYNSFATRLENFLKKIYSSNQFVWTRVLPHFKPLHVMRFDKNFTPLEIPPEFMSQNEVGIKKPTDTENYWICIFTENTNALLDKNEMTSFLVTKCRQFKKVGYDVVIIQRKLFYNNDQQDYLMKLLKHEIDSKLKEVAGMKLS